MSETTQTTLLLAGDTNLQFRKDPASAFRHLLPLLREAAVRFVNLEGPLAGPSDDPATPDIPHKTGWRHSEPGMVEGLVAAGIDAVGCANNVTYPPAAMLRSLAVLDEAGIAHAGGGRTYAEARRPVVLERTGVTYGFLSYTSVFWPVGHAAGKATPGVATIRAHTAYQPNRRVHEMPGGPPAVVTWPDPEELAAMESDVRTLRARADVVVVSNHWGVSGSSETCDYQRAIGRAAVGAGADIVIGHGPHHLQGVEQFKSADGRVGTVFYSLGNFVFDWSKMRGRELDGLIVRCTVRAKRVAEVSFVPVRRDEHNDPEPLSPASGDGARIADEVRSLSQSFGTEFCVAGDAVLVGAQDRNTG